MAVAVDAVSATDIVWGNVTTFSGTPITATASLTAVSASVVFSTTGIAPTGFTCTWGGTNIPAVTSADTGNIAVGGNTDRATIYGLATTTSGAQTFAGTWTTTAPGYANVMSWKGTDTTTPFKNGTSATGTSVTASVTVTSPANDFAVGCNFNTSSSTPTVNQTSWWNDTSGLNNNGAGNYTAGAGATVLSTTQTASGQWGYAACDVQVPAGAAAPKVSTVTELPYGWNTGPVYHEWWKWTHIANTNIPTPRILTQTLRVQRDWPLPTPPAPRLNDYTWIQQAITNIPVPRILTQTLRTQSTAPNPQPVTWYQSWTQNGIQSVPAINRQQDWPNPQPITWYQSWIDTGLSTLPIPTVLNTFRQSDWPNPQPITWYQSWIETGNALPRPTPFIPNDISIPYTVTWYRSWEEFGNALTSVTQNPFIQRDWPLPVQVIQIDRSWLLNNTIYQPTPPAVISEFGWQLIPGVPGIDQTWIQNLLQNTLSGPVHPPFFQTDWPLPRTYQPIDQFWSNSLRLLPKPTPFFQNVNAPLPVIPQPIDQTWVQNLVNILLSTKPPIAQFDWPLTKAPQPIDQTWIQNLSEFLQSETFPFHQSDYPNPPPVYWYRDHNQNLVLYLPVGLKPVNQSDWPLTGAPQPIDQFYYQALVLNLPPGPPPVPPITTAGRTWTKEQWTQQLLEYVKARQPKLLTFSEMGKMGGRPRKHT